MKFSAVVILAITPLSAVAAPLIHFASKRATCPPDVNPATVALIKEFEGFVESPDPDPIGLPTVGFGHLCKQAGCKEVPFAFPLTEDQAGQLLQTDLKTFTTCVKDNVKVPLNENQFGALSSFAFNLGCGNVKSSTLLKRLNAGEDPNTVAGEELPKFKFAGGQVLQGLVRRRKAEVDLFQMPTEIPAIPCQDVGEGATVAEQPSPKAGNGTAV